MKKSFVYAIVFSVAFIIAFGIAYATQPGQDTNPNGFPSGPHFNLNIHGKKSNFSCPELKYYSEITACPLEGCGGYLVGQKVESCPEGYSCKATTSPVYGNSIFVPENGENIKIYMQSGKSEGKGAKAASLPQTELWAIDPCAFDPGGATIQLPTGEYNVYARALAKPTDDPNLIVTPRLVGAEDESGNDLVYLGLVTTTGFVKADGETFTRSKGKSTAIPITGLFEWTGNICYFTDPGGTTPKTSCCKDIDGDFIYDYCCFDANNDGVYSPGECSGNTEGLTEPVACDILDIYCASYLQPEWIFNIADFVNYLWDTDNNGLKLVQVRFYPR